MNGAWLNADFPDSEDTSDDDFVPNGDINALDDNSGSSSDSDGSSAISGAGSEEYDDMLAVKDYESGDEKDDDYDPVTRQKKTKKTTEKVNGRKRGRGRRSLAKEEQPQTTTTSRPTRSSQPQSAQIESPQAVPTTSGFFPPNHPLRRLQVPFPLFSDAFTRFHEEQETEYRKLLEAERELAKRKEEAATRMASAKRRADAKKQVLKDTNIDMKQMRSRVEALHECLVPLFNRMIDSEEDVVDVTNAGPFLLSLAEKLGESGKR